MPSADGPMLPQAGVRADNREVTTHGGRMQMHVSSLGESTFMAELLRARRAAGPGLCNIVQPGLSCLKELGFSRLLLNEEAPEYLFHTEQRELVIVVLSGLCTVNVEAGSQSATFAEIGRRANVFAGLPTMAYVPCGAGVRCYSDSAECELALLSAPAERPYAPVLVYPEEAQSRAMGHGNWQVAVTTSIGALVDASRLLVGEMLCPPGNWCLAPPVRCEDSTGKAGPAEVLHQYRFNPPQGFALARAYSLTDEPHPFDFAFTILDGDTVTLSRGYYTLAAAPGYQMHVLWARASPNRANDGRTVDPAHAWILGSQSANTTSGSFSLG